MLDRQAPGCFGRLQISGNTHCYLDNVLLWQYNFVPLQYHCHECKVLVRWNIVSQKYMFILSSISWVVIMTSPHGKHGIYCFHVNIVAVRWMRTLRTSGVPIHYTVHHYLYLRALCQYHDLIACHTPVRKKLNWASKAPAWWAHNLSWKLTWYIIFRGPHFMALSISDFHPVFYLYICFWNWLWTIPCKPHTKINTQYKTHSYILHKQNKTKYDIQKKIKMHCSNACKLVAI